MFLVPWSSFKVYEIFKWYIYVAAALHERHLLSYDNAGREWVCVIGFNKQETCNISDCSLPRDGLLNAIWLIQLKNVTHISSKI